MTEHDHTHVDPTEAAQADDPSVGAGTPQTAPDVLPSPALAEPVALGGLTVLTGGVAALIVAGVPWYGALGFVALVLIVTAFQRAHVMPVR